MTPKQLQELLDLPSGYGYGAMWMLCALGYAAAPKVQSYGRHQQIFDVHEDVVALLKEKVSSYKKRPTVDEGTSNFDDS